MDQRESRAQPRDRAARRAARKSGKTTGMRPGTAGRNARRLLLVPALVLAGIESVVAALLASVVLVVGWSSVSATTRFVVLFVAWVLGLFLVTRVVRWLWRVGSESTPVSLALLIISLVPALSGRALVGNERLAALTPASLTSASSSEVETCFATLSAEDVLQKARRAAGSEVWRDDVIHNTMIAVCTGFRNVRNLEAYFMTAVQNAARKAHEGQWEPGRCSVARCPTPGPDVRLEHLEFAQAVRCQLSPEDSSILELYADGAPYREIAERFQINEATARQRLKRIRDRLAEQYADCNPRK